MRSFSHYKVLHGSFSNDRKVKLYKKRKQTNINKKQKIRIIVISTVTFRASNTLGKVRRSVTLVLLVTPPLVFFLVKVNFHTYALFLMLKVLILPRQTHAGETARQSV